MTIRPVATSDPHRDGVRGDPWGNPRMATQLGSSSIYPGFCTGGGELHLVWLEETTLTLRYASGVIR